MKIKALVAAVVVSTLPVMAMADEPAAAPASPFTQSPFVGPAGSPLAGKPDKAIPQTPEAWLHRMSNFTTNMSAYKDPRVFVPWFNAVTEPDFYTSMGHLMMDPSGWLRMFNSMENPGAYKNFADWAEPNIYMKWLAASMDPNFYTALLTTMTDPGKMMRWVMLPMDPKLWSMMMQGLNPAMYMKWMMSPLDPEAWKFMMGPINPNLYMAWLGTAMNPSTYGPTWANWFNTYNSATPAAATNPWGTTTNGVNFFDPNAWAKMWQVPTTQPAPAAQPAQK
jgi:hypothetical protein